MLQPITLQDRHGTRVVEDAAILPYAEMPKVVTWNDRIFLAHDLAAKPPVYREAFVGIVATYTTLSVKGEEPANASKP